MYTLRVYHLCIQITASSRVCALLMRVYLVLLPLLNINTHVRWNALLEEFRVCNLPQIFLFCLINCWQQRIWYEASFYIHICPSLRASQTPINLESWNFINIPRIELNPQCCCRYVIKLISSSQTYFVGRALCAAEGSIKQRKLKMWRLTTACVMSDYILKILQWRYRSYKCPKKLIYCEI